MESEGEGRTHMPGMPPGWSAALILSTLAVGLGACGREPSRTAEGPKLATRSVHSVVVQGADRARTTPVAATVQARQRAVLTARIPASVVELPVSLPAVLEIIVVEPASVSIAPGLSAHPKPHESTQTDSSRTARMERV